MTNHDQDNHPGNVKMRVQEWKEAKPEQRTQTLENNFIKRIKSEIEDQQGTPSFLIRDADDTQWTQARPDAIHEEILGEWRRQIDVYGLATKEQQNRRRQFLFSHKIIFLLAMVIVLAGIVGTMTVGLGKSDRDPNDNPWIEDDPDPNDNPGTEDDTDSNDSPGIENVVFSEDVAGSKTLVDIPNRNKLKCGVMRHHAFARQNERGIWEGFDVDLCRAVAAGIFGKDRFGTNMTEPIEFVPLEAGERFSSLNNKSIDLLVAMTSHTMERSLYEVGPIRDIDMLFE